MTLPPRRPDRIDRGASPEAGLAAGLAIGIVIAAFFALLQVIPLGG